MNRLRDWLNVPAIASVLSLFIAVVVLFYSLSLDEAFSILTYVALMLIILYAVYFLSMKVVLLIKSMSRVRFYLNWNTVPQRFRVEGTLADCMKERGTLEILARTGLRWFFGEEHKLDDNKYSPESDSEKSQLQRLITEAINSGAKIRFFLQNPHLSVPPFTYEQEKKLKKHFEVTVDSYKEIKSSSSILHPENLSLSVVDKLVDNSMVKFSVQSKIKHFIYDLGISFKAMRKQIGFVNKPFIVVLNPKEDMNDFIAEFEHEIAEAVPLDNFRENKDRAIKEAWKIIEDYGYFSEQRQDKSVNLIHAFVKNSIVLDRAESLPPPVCVQLLVTNRCSNTCKMCGHHLLYRETREQEMTKEEVYCVLDQINVAGAKTVIFSGGEPLCRADIFNLLEYASERLSVGLLTNGVNIDGEPIGENDAERIASSCQWVQVSLDSLNPDTYKKIRGTSTLESTIATIKRLSAAGAAVEVSVTLQHDNIMEATTFQSDFRERVEKNVPIRFKFVHGPDGSSDFLPTQKQIDNLVRSVRDTEGTNYGYLLAMLSKGFFDSQSLPLGEPVRRKMEEFNWRGFKCHALKLMCKIDPTGTVYPCCFLFDDNSSGSTIRDQFNLGSLRDGHSKRVVSSPKRFLEIWKSEKRRALMSQTLPINQKACFFCTRHFYQNEFLNLIDILIKKNKGIDLKSDILVQTESKAKEIFWM